MTRSFTSGRLSSNYYHLRVRVLGYTNYISYHWLLSFCILNQPYNQVKLLLAFTSSGVLIFSWKWR